MTTSSTSSTPRAMSEITPFVRSLVNIGFLPGGSINDIERFVAQSKNIEVEMRLGSFASGDKGRRFISGVTQADFDHIKRSLLAISTEKDQSFPLYVERSLTKVYTSGDVLRIETLDSSDVPVIYMKKERISRPVDVEQWNYRIASSKEEIISEEEGLKTEFTADEYRIRERISFQGSSENAPFHDMRVDLTHVTYTQRSKKNKEYFNRETFEVEIERRNKMSVAKLYQSIVFLYLIYQRLNNIFLLDYFEGNVVGADILTRIEGLVEMLMSSRERTKIIATFNSFFRSRDTRALILHKNEPVNVKLENLFDVKKPYAVTAKLDGKRKFLFINDEGVFLLNPPYEIVKISNEGVIQSAGSLVDGEFIVTPGSTSSFEYYAFDLLVFEGENGEKEKFTKRIAAAKNAMKPLNITNFSFMVKDFHYSEKSADPVADFYSNVNKGFEDIDAFEASDRGTDGLILQPLNEPYINKMTYKWKPPSMLTIDFRVVKAAIGYDLLTTSSEEEEVEATPEEVDEAMLRFTEGKKGKRASVQPQEKRKARKGRTFALFRGSAEFPYEDSVAFDDERFQGELVDNRIIEFTWNGTNFEPVRFRDDKPFPNRTDVALDVWHDINDPISQTTIKGEDLRLMNLFHSSVKKRLLSKFYHRGNTLMDIGSGPGTDIKIWNEIGFKKVYGIEDDPDLVDDFKRERIRLDSYNVEVVEASADDTKKITKSVDSADEISAFYSLNYFIKDQKTMLNFINTIDETLAPEGYFMGFLLDKDRVTTLLDGEDTFQNEAFSIERRGAGPVIHRLKVKKTQVGSDKEYVFDFEDLAIKLSGIGADMISKPIPSTLYNVTAETIALGEKVETAREKAYQYSNSFIDQGIDMLPPASRAFSRLFRIFVFRRRENPLETGQLTEKQQLKLKVQTQAMITNRAKEFETSALKHTARYATIGGPSNIFHAIRWATSSKKYVAADNDEKIKMVLKFRTQIADGITLDLYQTLGGGYFARELTKDWQNALKSTKEVAQTRALTKFTDMIREPESIVDGRFEVIQAISDVLNVNIFLIDATSKKPYLPQGEDRSLNLKTRCDLLYKDDRKSIILLSINGVHFEVIGQPEPTRNKDGELVYPKKIPLTGKTIFSSSSKIVARLRETLCSKSGESITHYGTWSCLKDIIEKNGRAKVFDIALKKADTSDKKRVLTNLAFLTDNDRKFDKERTIIYNTIIQRLDLIPLVIESYHDSLKEMSIDDRLKYIDSLTAMNETEMYESILDLTVGKWFDEFSGRKLDAPYADYIESPNVLVQVTERFMKDVSTDKYFSIIHITSTDRKHVAVALSKTLTRMRKDSRVEFLGRLRAAERAEIGEYIPPPPAEEEEGFGEYITPTSQSPERED